MSGELAGLIGQLLLHTKVQVTPEMDNDIRNIDNYVRKVKDALCDRLDTLSERLDALEKGVPDA